MRIRFASEAENASRLDHPNIVGVVDFGRTEHGLMYLAMELVEGRTLGAALREHTFDPARAVHIATQLCDGLAHAHTRGVVHRDFKPENILLLTAGDHEVARIADFGLAISTLDDDARMTTSGVLCTPAYAAPEQLLNQTVDHRADLYALGVTLFEMLSGAMPFGSEPSCAVARKLIGEEPTPDDLAAHVPAYLAPVIARLMARSPDDRYASAADVRRALEDAECDRVPVAPPRRSSRSPRTAIAIGAAVLVATGAVAWMSSPERRDLAGSTQLDAWSSEPAAEPSSRAIEAPAQPPPSHDELRVVEAPAQPSPSRDQVRVVELIASPLHAREVVAIVPARPASPPRKPAVAPPPAPPPTEATTSPAIVVEPPASVEKPVLPPKRPVAPPPPPVRPAPPAPPVPPVERAQPLVPRIAQLDVEGGLAPSVVRRAVERILPHLDGCLHTAGRVTARFTIEDGRRPLEISTMAAPGAAGSCVTAALARARTEEAPDVGAATVRVTIEYGAPR
jgi:serine/threonine-protein kinase